MVSVKPDWERGEVEAAQQSPLLKRSPSLPGVLRFFLIFEAFTLLFRIELSFKGHRHDPVGVKKLLMFQFSDLHREYRLSVSLSIFYAEGDQRLMTVSSSSEALPTVKTAPFSSSSFRSRNPQRTPQESIPAFFPVSISTPLSPM